MRYLFRFLYYVKMIWKKWRARKKDQAEIILHEVNRALKRQETRNMVSMENVRMSYVRGQNALQSDMQRETEKVKQDAENNYRYKLKQLKIDHENEINALNKIISEARGKIKYAQEFWRRLYADSDSLHNIATVLKSKAMLLLEQRTADYQGITAQCEQLDLINRTLDKNSSAAEKLIFLQIENTEGEI